MVAGEASDRGARKKLDMDTVLAENNQAIPPPPARYVSPFEKKKMKKEAEGTLEKGDSGQGSSDAEHGGKEKEDMTTSVLAASIEEDRPAQ
jgi:hypothetical protein